MLPASPRAVFISYAREDRAWLDRFLQILEPLIRQDDFTVCSDLDIEIGGDWQKHIQAHLNGARAAVLLVSPAFLASRYIANNELPVLLKNASNRGVRILPILISPSLFSKARFKYPNPETGPDEVALSSLQAANSPSRTLAEMPEAEQDRVFLDVADWLQKIVKAEL